MYVICKGGDDLNLGLCREGNHIIKFRNKREIRKMLEDEDAYGVMGTMIGCIWSAIIGLLPLPCTPCCCHILCCGTPICVGTGIGWSIGTTLDTLILTVFGWILSAVASIMRGVADFSGGFAAFLAALTQK